MKTLKREELSKRAKDQEKQYWELMRSADSGNHCYS